MNIKPTEKKKKKHVHHRIKGHEQKQTHENPHENHTAVTLLKWVGNFNLTGWVFANRSVQQFPDSTNHYTTPKKSLQITNPKLIVNRPITATTRRRFHSQVSLFESHGSGGATSFDYEQLKCLRIIAQSRFWKFLELRTATFLTRIRIVQFGHPKKLTGTTMTESIRNRRHWR